MKILTPEEMRKCDRYTIEETGISEEVLMERAAHSVVRSIVEEPSVKGNRVMILCGGGNNGGDGLVIAKELCDLGYEVHVAIVSGISKLSKGNLKNLDTLSRYSVGIKVYGEDNSDEFEIDFGNFRYDMVIDSIFGTGQSKKIPKHIDDILKTVNMSSAVKIAVDIPTGIDALSGVLLAKNPFKSDLTVSFAFAKTGALVFPGREYVGKLRIAYIGMKNDTPEKIGWKPKYLMNEATAKKLIPARNPSGHKGTFGKVAVVGGSHKFKGAPILSAKAAFETGCGMIHLVSAMDGIEPYAFPELISHKIGICGDYLSFGDYDDVLEILSDKDVMVLGPGMGREYSTCMLVMKLLENTEMPVVLDADALYALSETPVKIPKNRMSNVVLTPHIKEFSRLCGLSVETIEENYLDAGSEFARRTGCILALKSSTTVIFTPNGEAIFNINGNSGLAKAGSGDVLSGIIGGFMGQGCSPLRSAQLGVFMAGLGADIYSDENTQYTLTPSKVIDFLPKVFNRICGKY